jgi:secondary thiamine-phosphate synthase enzyme
MFSYTIGTQKESLTDITREVRDALQKSGVRDGLVTVFVPHTTAAVTINENADPDVRRDLLLGLSLAFPDRPEFRHSEGNSSAHLRASAVGSSVQIFAEGGALVLGTWQAVFFCEFDGPRTRKFFVQVMG